MVDMKETKRVIKLKKIDLSKRGKGEDTCRHPDINPTKCYIVKYDDAEMIGHFEEEWYGWNFDWFGSSYAGLQLDCLDEVWEIV